MTIKSLLYRKVQTWLSWAPDDDYCIFTSWYIWGLLSGAVTVLSLVKHYEGTLDTYVTVKQLLLWWCICVHTPKGSCGNKTAALIGLKRMWYQTLIVTDSVLNNSNGYYMCLIYFSWGLSEQWMISGLQLKKITFVHVIIFSQCQCEEVVKVRRSSMCSALSDLTRKTS